MAGQLHPPVSQVEKDISDLEKFYFEDLYKEFQDPSFLNSLKSIESWLSKNYSSLGAWAPKNKLALPFQRLIAYHMFRHYKHTQWIYTAPISSDVAFETKNAIINIDAKSVSKTGNFGDWGSLFLKPNQASFNQKNFGNPILQSNSYPGIEAKFNLPTKDIVTGKPILSFFLMALYTDIPKKKAWEFTQNHISNMKFVCVPNGELSKLFNNDLGITGAKTWNWELTSGSKSNKKKITKPKNHVFAANHFEITAASKEGWYDPIEKKSWLNFVETKTKKEVYASALSVDTVRIKYKHLENRFDSSTRKTWNGHKEWKV